METSKPIEQTSQAPLRRQGRRAWMLLAAVAAIHIPSLFNPFFIDDYVYLDTVHDLDAAGVADLFTSSTLDEKASGVWWAPAGALPFYRPIGELTFAADYLLWGMRAFGYHLTNLILHVACMLLVWRLALWLFKSSASALAAAMVFGLHPVHTEAVVWVSGRFDLLACFCLLASALAYLNWQRGHRRAWCWGGLSVVMFVIGLGCKETALAFPAVLVVLELLRWRGSEAAYRPRRLATAAGAFGIIALLYVGLRFALFGGLGSIPPPYGLDTSSAATAVRGIAGNLVQYLLDFVLFIQVDAVYLAEFWSSHVALTAALVLLALLVCVAGAVLAWRLRGFRVGLVWTALCTAPALMAMPGERNVYTASVGVALMVAAALTSLWLRANGRPVLDRWVRRVAYGIVGVWAVLLMVELGVGRRVAATSEKVFRDIEAVLPNPPQGARIYVVNQCPLNSVGFAQALRLRYGRPDLSGCALSLSPTLIASTTDQVIRTGPNSIRLVREGGVFFASFVERFHLFSEPVSTLSKSCRRSGFELISPPTSYDHLTELEFRFPYPLDDPRMQLLVWDNRRIRNAADVFRMTSPAQVRRCDPL